MRPSPGINQCWAGHFNRRAARNRCIVLVALFLLWLLLVFSPLLLFLFPNFAYADCDGFSLEVGIGAHDPAIDGPEYTTRNALGIIEARYQRGPWSMLFTHTSSMEGWPAVWNSPSETGYGANVISARYRLGPW